MSSLRSQRAALAVSTAFIAVTGLMGVAVAEGSAVQARATPKDYVELTRGSVENSSALKRSSEAEPTADLFGPDAGLSSLFWTPQGLDTLARRSSQSGSSSDLIFDLAKTAIGSSTLSNSSEPLPPGFPPPTRDDITEVKLLSRTPEGRPDVERWRVASPAMKRVIDVEVRLAPDPDAPAPVLVLLDGIGSLDNSDWVKNGAADNVFGDQQVVLVMPDGAWGSLYLDWQRDDPNLGRVKWDTFISQELTPLVEKVLNTNSKRAIGGLSMGASGAVMIANAHPGLYDAVFGLSGCYSTTTPLGELMVRAVVETRSGSVSNLWGDASSGAREHYDAQGNPSGLSDSRVFLGVGNGAWTLRDSVGSIDQTPGRIFSGLLLERGAMRCTREMRHSLEKAQHPDFEVKIYDHGLHNWEMFNEEVRDAWDAVKSVLY